MLTSNSFLLQPAPLFFRSCNMGPRTTSPIAQTLGRLVLQSASTNCFSLPRLSPRPRIEPNGVCNLADGNNHLSARRLSCALRIDISNRHTCRIRLISPTLHAKLDFQSLLCEGFESLLAPVDQPPRKKVRPSPVTCRAQPTPDRTHLQADDASADEHQLLGTLLHRRESSIVDKILSNGIPGTGVGVLERSQPMMCCPVNSLPF
jgi:hypothetical protein